MTFRIKWRLAGLVLAVALMGALIVLVTLNSERQSEVTHARLSEVDSQSFRIADRFKDKLRYANDKMRHYAIAREPALWQEFLTASEEVKSWIAGAAPQLSTEAEKDILRKMALAQRAHHETARRLHDRLETSGQNVASLAEYNAFFEQSRRLNDLGQELARAHFESRNLVLTEADQTLSRLRLLVLGLLSLLFLFGVSLAGVVYRDLIAPLQVKLVKSQALAERHEKLASLGLLAAGVAHEVRGPLTAIKTALFLQQKRFQPGSPEQNDAAVINREILRLERIVHDFLLFARPAEPKLTAFSAQVPLREVQALFAEQFSRSDIQLVCEESTAANIKADPAQIKQVLINLVQNAADSIQGAGRITLRARPDRRRLSNGETDVVVLEVSDTGSGIPPDVEKRLFDPFFSTKETGTGLGLSIAARIVQKHGGALQYQTQPHRGTTFGVVLPRDA
ncbi:Signal transduction histidine kinase, nitrogen specific, NtrB [Verrucomicrobia bacterium]|nr:Signal transduction histidine kinase, nitrogen specific, NtrB [Verrucomicrobiota bacterium]